MTARNSALGALNYEAESSFGENTETYSIRLLPVDRLDVTGLVLPKQNYNPLRQYPHDGEQDIRLGYDGEFEATFMLAGHGGTAAGSLTATELATFLSKVIGSMDSSGVGATVDASPPPAIDGFTATGITLTNKSFLRVGTMRDGRGDGQFRTGSEFGDAITLDQDLDAAPNAGDQVYAALCLYPNEGVSTQLETISSLRMQIMTGNNQFNCHGCYPKALSFDGLNPGELPRIKVRFGVAWWITDNDTFPDATATAAKVPAPVANGSFFLQEYGTTTQGHYNIRQFALEIQHEVAVVKGPGGVYGRQVITDAKRLRSQAKLTCTFDAEAAGTTTFWDIYNTDENTVAYYHILNTLSCEDGKAVGFYFPRCKIVDPAPTQVDMDGLNRVTATFEALTDTSHGTDLIASNWRMALG